MQDKKLKIALVIGILGVVLAFAGLCFVQARYEEETAQLLAMAATQETSEATTEAVTETTTERDDAETTGEPSVDETTEETVEETTEEPTEETTEPGPEHFVLTFVGDCTLGSTEAKKSAASSFVGTVGDDYDYPFANVREYFENDDFTMANLEVVLADSGVAADKTFAFRGPTAYTQILTGSSVEAVTLANNHTMDYGKTGYSSTKTALESAGVTYVETDGSALYTTESGLVIGLYAVSFDLDKNDMKKDIAALRTAGAEIVIVAFHWGTEGSYRAASSQTSYAHACIDAGADIVYGHHPHVLQRIEAYNGGIIYYSLGNFSFGGNTFPRDMDSVIIQQEIIRDVDGTVRLGELILIPVSISSMSGQNNYQPIPYEVGSTAYDRTLSKLDGTFTGPDLVVDYSFLEDPTESTEDTTPTEPDTGSGESSGDEPAGGDSGSSGDSAESGGSGDSGDNSSGSDTGNAGSDNAGDEG